MLAIRPFRRLWAVTALCAIGDWLSLLALSALATQLTEGYQAQSFALGGVVATKLLPAMLLGPLAGAIADKLDRRRVMVVCDVLRFGLFLSIPFVGTLWWLFLATFMIEICALFWIPAKDASIPNLLRRPDQVETANQLGLVMTYGVAVIVAAGLFSFLSQIDEVLGKKLVPDAVSTAHVALVINGLAYLACAIVVGFRIREISGRPGKSAGRNVQPGLLAMLRDGFAFVGGTPLVRGLVIGILGAFAAGGAVIACAKLYATSLGGGDGAYGMLFVSVFVGLAAGMAVAPQLARRMPHNRLFGVAIVAAGLTMVPIALAVHLFVAIATTALVGALAGVAFLTGLTIIGTQVDDAIRGRTISFVQSIVRVDLLASMALVPVLVGLVQPRLVIVFGQAFTIDGTRTVLFGAGLVAAVVGVLAYRQMDDRRAESILTDLRVALSRRRRATGGLLIAVEGNNRADTADQAGRLADWLREGGREVLLTEVSPLDEQRLRAVLDSAGLTGERARALVAAALRAEVVERQIRPALAAGTVVVMERYVDSPIAHLGAEAGVTPSELEGLVDWATGRLRPDLTVLLDRNPDGFGSVTAPRGLTDVEHHWKVQKILTELAAANPDRYVVVDADDTPDTVAARVRQALAPLLPPPPRLLWPAVPVAATARQGDLPPDDPGSRAEQT
ncbi:MAG TPA: MFS transporter [Pseudonocardiaceae bacterium]|nr:MFS transporter [Pseudonocardiaceae bacterium]